MEMRSTAKGGSTCAWHSQAWNNNIINVRFYPYINLPYMPDVAKGCATNGVNKGFDSFGHGIFDGVSKVAGHEWAEALTDPHMDGWYGALGLKAETGDKCNDPPFGNIGAKMANVEFANLGSEYVLVGEPTESTFARASSTRRFTSIAVIRTLLPLRPPISRSRTFCP